MRQRIEEKRGLIVFFCLFTLICLTVYLLWIYCMPFVLSLLAAVVMRPTYGFLKRRFRFQAAFCATVLTLLLFLMTLSAVAFVLFLIVREFIQFIHAYSDVIGSWIRDPQWIDRLSGFIGSSGMFDRISGIALGITRLIPAVISLCVITFALTVFFLNRLDRIRDRIVALFSPEWRDDTARVISIGYLFVRRFIRSYLILYLITFVEATFIFYLTGVRYPLYLGFIAAFADLLPILGPGTVYIPIALRFILYGNYIGGITLVVFFLVTVIIRQIIEPRIVSDTIKISPLVVLSAIYFSIVSLNIGVFFYVLLLVLCYRILAAAEVL